MYFDDGNGLERAGGSERDVNEGNVGRNDNRHGCVGSAERIFFTSTINE